MSIIYVSPPVMPVVPARVLTEHLMETEPYAAPIDNLVETEAYLGQLCANIGKLKSEKYSRALRAAEVEKAFQSLHQAQIFCKSGAMSVERYYKTAVKLALPFSTEENIQGWKEKTINYRRILLGVMHDAIKKGIGTEMHDAYNKNQGITSILEITSKWLG